MRVVIVYESMFGNTHEIADHIGAGFAPPVEVVVSTPDEVTSDMLDGAALLVAGGPTHVHGMASPRTRDAAVESARNDDDLELDPAAEGQGLRAWFDAVARHPGLPAAAFDTRIDVPAAISGRASKGIVRRLKHLGCTIAAPPQSFLVDKHNRLLDGEADRATQWGRTLAETLAATLAEPADPAVASDTGRAT